MSSVYQPKRKELAKVKVVSTHIPYDDGYGNINPLYMLFNSGSEENSADTYEVSSENIMSRLENSYSNFGGNKINGKYSEYMFESVDSSFTEVNLYADENILADEKRPLTSELINKNWWDRLWGKETVNSTTFDDIKAIYKVQDSDLSGTVEQVSKKIYISSSDVADFKSFYNSKKSDCSIYLFRYQISDYISQEASVKKKVNDLFGFAWESDGTNAYFFQETVNLDFDIIDVTFSTGEVETVIPVVSNPIDVIGSATPPVYTTPDNPSTTTNILKLILGLVLLIFLLWFLNATGALTLVGKILTWVIIAPFKFLRWLICKIGGD